MKKKMSSLKGDHMITLNQLNYGLKPQKNEHKMLTLKIVNSKSFEKFIMVKHVIPEYK